jgi:3-isopropylmalate/(R)-2-methylmalate dehydratase small subunit
VSPEFLNLLFEAIDQNANIEITVDLENQSIGIAGTDILAYFEIDPFKKICLIKGYDDIDFLVSKKKLIEIYESERMLVG